MRQNAGARARGGRRGRSGLALGVVAALAVVLAGCGSSDSAGDATAKGSGSGRSTTSTTAAGAVGGLSGSFVGTDVSGHELVAGSELTVTFEDGQLSVHGGCNTLGGAYTFEDGTVKWEGQARSTMMACDDALTAQDAWLTTLFTKGVDAVLDGTTLVLSLADVEITLEQVADAPLTGTTWTLDGTIANEAVSSLPADADPPTLTIDDDGKVAVFAGCNRGSSTVEVTDTTLTFSPVALTKMACPDPAGALEAQVTKVLDGEVDYVVDGGTLTITNGSDGLVYKSA